jgi:hypothetical protein
MLALTRCSGQQQAVLAASAAYRVSGRCNAAGTGLCDFGFAWDFGRGFTGRLSGPTPQLPAFMCVQVDAGSHRSAARIVLSAAAGTFCLLSLAHDERPLPSLLDTAAVGVTAWRPSMQLAPTEQVHTLSCATARAVQMQ